MLRKGEVRDANVDYLIRKVYVPSLAFVANTATPTVSPNSPQSFAAGFSAGSSSYVNVPNSRTGAIKLAATTSYIDYDWRIPQDMDKRWPVYFRYWWTADVLGTTNTVTFKTVYAIASLTTAIPVIASPTTALSPTMAASAYPSGTVQNALVATGRGQLGPLASGAFAGQTLPDDTEYIHIAINPNATSYPTATGSVYFIGMDLEYTPRVTFGDGSHREGRKMQTNLGFGEVGAAADY